jgi:hypothetical protein
MRKSRKINAALAAAREAKKNKNLLDIFPTEAITNKKSMILTILNQLLFKCLGSKLATACFLTGTNPTELGKSFKICGIKTCAMSNNAICHFCCEQK